jgi:hypothetical protein
LFYSGADDDREVVLLVKTYLIPNPHASANERRHVDQINQKGGTGPLYLKGQVVLVIAIITGAVWLLAPSQSVSRLAFLCLVVVVLVGYFTFYAPMQAIHRRHYDVTDNPDLIALDKAWQLVVAEQVGAWQMAEDCNRFFQVKALAGRPADEVRDEIKQLLAKLTSGPPTVEDAAS